MSALPSVKQMLNRAQSGHLKALQAIAEGRVILGSAAFDSEIRGMRICLSTLRKWECIADAAGDLVLTDRGRALLAASVVSR